MRGPPELGRSFGQVASEYDRWRPDYPAELYEWITARVAGRRAAEIGAGTGKATVGFVRAGFKVTAVEPDPAMAAVGAARVPAARWVVEAAETWSPDSSFDLVYGAQAWHWVPEEVDSALAATLAADGAMAWFWNHPHVGAETQVLGDIYARHMPESEQSWRAANHRRDPDYWRGRLARILPEVEIVELPWERTLSADDYVALTGTYSDHIALETARRDALQQAIRERLEEQGGTIILSYVTRAYLGRRA